jgi:hypothetical protein
MQLKTIVLACSCAVLAGCATVDPRDAPWDPPAGRALFEQLPAWDGAAEKICGGHLHPDEARRRGLSRRC